MSARRAERVSTLIEGVLAGLRSMPRAALICALIAFLNAACWSLITPPFQDPDEPDHVAYVQSLVETGHLPVKGAPSEFTNEDIYAFNDLRQGLVRFKPQIQSISSRSEQSRLEFDLARPELHGEAINAGLAAGEPPLYYVLETIPYQIASAGSLLDRVQLMRLLSALMGALAAFFSYLFVREALPGVERAWIVGGLAVALVPLFGAISGAVNPESMLIAVSAALFYLLARAFRRGFTTPHAIAIGLVVAVGLLTKVNFVGLLPGVLVGLLVLTRRAARVDGRAALGALATAFAIACTPVAVYVLLNAVAGRPVLGVISEAFASQRGTLAHEISYIWQFYLPRLPGMHAYFPGVLTTRQLWFNGFVGLYGWADTAFPGWVYTLALVPAGILALLCARALLALRGDIRARAGELVTYAGVVVGLMLLVGADSYTSETSDGTGPYYEPRYFLPLIPLLGAALALAARGAGRRRLALAGILIVVLFLGHDAFSQLQTIARYYG
jgi:4-amino-4-deoxy-L-arabinose transferase-like glycosyltransferase